MNDRATLVSKVLVLDSNTECYDQIKLFCDTHNLVGLKVHEENVLPVLKSNIDLGGILLSESYGGNDNGGIALAREIHRIRPELPIFLRREEIPYPDNLSGKDRKLFSASYTIADIASLRSAIDASIFSQVYPNALIRGIVELTITALESQFNDMGIDVEAPYLVRDRLIFGEIFTMIPLESSWCRGYMMLQVEEEPLLHLVRAERTHTASDNNNDFRHLNNILGEITNLIWGTFKNRYISHSDNIAQLSQVPIIVNHLHRYISFGSEDPQLCFKYTLNAKNDKDVLPLTIYQRFVFNLNWSPDDFKVNQVSVEAWFESGELELF
ncbi:MAG: chemotaxis protein CheX [Burkholderiales bacterium]